MNSRSKAPVRLAFSLAVALCLSACGQEPPVADVPMTVQEAMVEHIDVVADEVWAVGNAAMAGNSVLDRNLMTDTDWARLVDAATRLQTSANRLGFMDRYVVSRTGVVISDGRAKGGIASAQVQEYIDADVSGFRGLAAALASHSNDLAAAAKARDATRAGRLIGELDGVCESCHLEFWYPEQRQMVEALSNGAGPKLPAS